VKAFIVVVQLAAGIDPIAFEVDSCVEAPSWVRKATDWAKRSGLDPVNGPLWACGRREIMLPLNPTLLVLDF
jgi:hypothetical protein